MKLRLMLAAALLVVIVVTGCQRKRFEVVMQLTDGGVRRTVSIWTEDDVDSNGHSTSKILPRDDQTSNGLAAIYGLPETLPDGRMRYAGEFSGDLPADLVAGPLHNFARVHVIRSPLGTTVSYLERLPGRTDMVAVARAGEKAIDLLIAAWGAYAAEQPDFRAAPDKLALLRDFLQQKLRADMLNLGLAMWLETGRAEGYERADVSSNGASGDDFLIARASAFLLERGYLQTADMMTLPKDEMPLVRGVARRLASELGYPSDAPLPPTLAAFADGTVSLESITSCGLAALDTSEEDMGSNAELLMGNFTNEKPSGSIQWTGVAEQPRTNGRWDAQSQTLTWSAEYREGAQLPEVLFATFTTPNTAFATEHLGRTMPAETVGDFNTWYATLTPQQQSTVSTFCTSLKPGSTLRDEILRFDLTAPDGRAALPRDPSELPAGMNVLLPPE